jgi:hypothetical protein
MIHVFAKPKYDDYVALFSAAYARRGKVETLKSGYIVNSFLEFALIKVHDLLLLPLKYRLSEQNLSRNNGHLCKYRKFLQ